MEYISEMIKFYTYGAVGIFIFSIFYYLYKSKLGFLQVWYCFTLAIAWPIGLFIFITDDIDKCVENKKFR